MGVSNKKKALLHVAKTELGLDDDLYRGILKQEAGVESSKKLTLAGFDKVMHRFEKLGFVSKNRKVRALAKDPAATPSQVHLDKIDELYSELGWHDKRRQIGFNRRVTGKPWPQTRTQANKIIEALKSMIERGYRG